MGVIGALYYFVMQYVHKKGIKSILVGNSMPVVLDGVTEFKLQLGATPFQNDLGRKEKYYFLPVKYSKSLFTALKSNPIYFLRNGKLDMAIFIRGEDYQSRSDFLKFFKRLKTEQVGCTRIFTLGQSENLQNWLEEVGAEKLEIIDLLEGSYQNAFR
jgi:hypothetical protein